MVRIYKKQILEELTELEEMNLGPFHKKIDELTYNQNKLIRYHDASDFTYYCTKCRSWHPDKKVKLKSKKRCPYCGKKFEVIGFRNVINPIEDYISAIEVNERKELIIRLFCFWSVYDKDTARFSKSCFEVARINFDRKIAIKKDTYWAMGNGWRHSPGCKSWSDDKSRRSSYYGYENKFTDSYIYSITITKNIKKLIFGTKYKYSALDIVAKHGIDIVSYLKLYEQRPEVERIAKMKCLNLLDELVYGKCSFSKVENLLKNKEIMKLIVKNDLSSNQATYANDFNLSDKKMIIMAEKVRLQKRSMHHNLTKLLPYLCKQYQDYGYYYDYLSNAKLLGYDVNNKKVVYPKKLKEAHDCVMAELKELEDKIYNEKICEYAKELEHLSFSNKKYMIRPVISQEELIKESEELDHCVRSYAKRVAKRETSIFVIRLNKKRDTPLVTLELKDNEVIQARASGNECPEDAIQSFIRQWEQKFQLSGY